MPVFAVIPFSDDAKAKLEKAITALEQADEQTKAFPMQNQSGFLVKYKGISKELSEALEIITQTEDGQTATVNGPAIVLSVDGYWGYGSGATWEWLRTYGNE